MRRDVVVGGLLIAASLAVALALNRTADREVQMQRDAHEGHSLSQDVEGSSPEQRAGCDAARSGVGCGD